MGFVRKLWIVLGAVALVVVLAGVSLASTYNDLVSERTQVETQAKQVDVQYQRAFALLPRLTGLAQQYMSNETQVLERVTALRSGYAPAVNGSLSDKDRFIDEYQQFVLLVQGRQEAYPALRSNELFRDTMEETINTHNKVATEKVRYNEVAGAYNAHIQKCCMPMLAAGLFGFEKAELIGFSDRPAQQPFPSGQPL